MPFVIGVLGVGGKTDGDFQNAMAAPAASEEFKGNVVAVRTGRYWDKELQRSLDKVREAASKKALAENPELARKPRSLQNAIRKMQKGLQPEVLTPEELKIIQLGQSNAAYHCNGSAYIYGNIGKAFAEAMIDMQK